MLAKAVWMNLGAVVLVILLALAAYQYSEELPLLLISLVLLIRITA